MIIVKRTIILIMVVVMLLPIEVSADIFINIPKYQYIINYYQDDLYNPLGIVEGEEYLNRKIDIDFNYLVPEGYFYLGKTNYYVIEDNMSIDVIYTKKNDLSYCVNYFYDGIISINDTECYYNKTFGEEITTFVDKPREDYKFVNFDSITILDIEENIMNVYYEKVHGKEEIKLGDKIISYVLKNSINVINKLIRLLKL